MKNAALPPRGLWRFCRVFLRRHRKIINHICYDYWSLRESVRTAAGPCQRVVATLGKLSQTATHPEAGWDEMKHLLEGRPTTKQLRLGEKPRRSQAHSSQSPARRQKRSRHRPANQHAAKQRPA